MKKLLLSALMLSVGVYVSAVHAQDNSAGVPSAPVPDTAVVSPAPPPVVSDPAFDTPVPPPAPEQVLAAVPPSNSQPGVVLSPIEREINDQLAYLRPNIDVNSIKSLFFTVWEHDLVLDARRGLITRTPGSDDGIAEVGPRDITLGGIVYRSGKDWTIWLNSTRVSPDAIPDEILDLRVFKEYVELEWFDETTNQVFPIRLRAHQRFNLDTRMFLPG